MRDATRREAKRADSRVTLYFAFTRGTLFEGLFDADEIIAHGFRDFENKHNPGLTGVLLWDSQPDDGVQYKPLIEVVLDIPVDQKDAERQDLILKNPASSAQAPKRARVKLEVWTEAQTLLFLSEAKDTSPYYPVYLFLVGTGARIGEALGLTWRDLALGDGVAYIAQALQRTDGGGYALKEPKTAHSRRAITLPPEGVECLRSQRAQQEEEQKRPGPCEGGAQCTRPRCKRWHALDLVFCQPNGKPLHDNNVRQRDLRPLCVKLSLPYHRALHNFRHGHGSHLLQRGVSVKVVQERLGHATASFTLSTYAHVLAGAEAQAARAISAMLRGDQ
jgi:integrase